MNVEKRLDVSSKSVTNRKGKSINFRLSAVNPYLYLLPAILFIMLFIYSAFYTLVYSFTDWDGINKANWVGLKNYLDLFKSDVMITSFTNTIIWVVVSLILPVGLGLLLSVVLQNIIGKTILKNIFYLPYAISLTTTGVIWGFLFSANGINELLEAIHLLNFARNWLQEPPFNTISMLIASVWQSTGTNMILFLVGLQTLPREPHEAAMIDGASRFRIFFSITMPLLKPFTIVVAGMALVNSFKVFDIIWVMTQGGPYRSSETLAVTMYRESFVLNHLGAGSAIAMVLTILVFLLSWVYLKQTIVKGD